MITKKHCLLLGKTKNILKLKKEILKRNWKVTNKSKKIFLKDIKNIDLVISFNYKHILKKDIIKNLKRPAINLHISYLPFNKGAHPNFWSFVEKSPKGVTIHEINRGIDDGPIIYQKKVFFNIRKKNNNSFFKTHKILNFEVEKLFIKKINLILNKKYKLNKQKHKGTIHYKKDLPQFVKKCWKSNIKIVLNKFN
jgi:methionyl-tRNA formyltransferase